MKTDFYLSNNNKSTYFQERGKCCLSNTTIAMKYRKIERDVIEAKDLGELAKQYEIKSLDDSTRLLELKFDKIRVVHFTFEDQVFVFLDTFIKKTRQTPPEIIKRNNKRIEKYKEQKNGEKNE